MSFWRLVTRSLWHFRGINFTVALGVAAATAVLTGALIVGDSVRGSLSALTLDRLGKIDEVLVGDRFFRTQLAAELAATPRFDQHYEAALPIVLIPNATLEGQHDGKTVRANLTVVGCDKRFWTLGDGKVQPDTHPGEDQIVINEQLAGQLFARVGAAVTLRLPRPSAIPSDSPYGRKEDTVNSLPGMEVTDVLPNKSLGRFSLHPNQSLPRVAFVSLETLQGGLGVKGKANAILVGGKTTQPASTEASDALHAALKPKLADYGLAFKPIRRTFSAAGDEQTVYDYFSLTSDRMLIPPEAEQSARAALASLRAQPVFVYFVDGISLAEERDKKSGVPYSIVAAIDPSREFNPLDPGGENAKPLKSGEIILTDWAANYLGAKIGDSVALHYFEPETSHGKTVESEEEFTVVAITPLTEPAEPYEGETPAVFDKRPTLANDPDFTPVVEGITDKDSIADLDVPFPFDINRLRPRDHEFWARHRTTPKAYIGLEDGRRLWGSRFGAATSLRIPAADGVSEETLAMKLAGRLRSDGHSLGLQLQPIKRRDLAASAGTTPFDVLFLLLSMFIITAALMLVSLLFRLGVEKRFGQIGALLAMGFTRKVAARVLSAEGAIVAALGAALGLAAGVGYARLMLFGLRTIWVDAVVTPFLEMHIHAKSLPLGFILGVLASLLTIVWGVRLTRNAPVGRLLAGRGEVSTLVARGAGVWPTIIALGLLVVAIALAIAATGWGGEAQAGCFVGSGAMVLASLLSWIRSRLRRDGGRTPSMSLIGLAFRNAGRNPGRSTMTIGLMAVASFLIVSMSSFRLDPSKQGSGGFDLAANSSQSIPFDLNLREVRDDLMGDDAGVLDGGTVLSFRLKPGDDASCRNLYRSRAPRILGVTPATVAYFDDEQNPTFAFAGSAAESEEEKKNPWRTLAAATTSDAIPVILDKNTAMYSLQLYGGIGQEFTKEYEGYGEIKFRVVGLLSNSVLQGSLLIGQSHFEDLFSDIGGYRFFLLRSPAGKSQAVAEAMENWLGDQGFDTESTEEILIGLLAVQNTYLSTFQSLGALGLLLGTFGLATVQLRNVFERRGELAVMRASGFRRRRLAEMVMFENLVLLLGGLFVGVFSAAVAVAPHMIVAGASTPWTYLLVVLGIVLAFGFLASFTSVRATLTAPLLSAIRGD